MQGILDFLLLTKVKKKIYIIPQLALQYDPTEPGDYRVEVKWAGELVPGSPFHVMIFDTQEELRRYINSL